MACWWIQKLRREVFLLYQNRSCQDSNSGYSFYRDLILSAILYWKALHRGPGNICIYDFSDWQNLLQIHRFFCKKVICKPCLLHNPSKFPCKAFGSVEKLFFFSPELLLNNRLHLLLRLPYLFYLNNSLCY